MKRFFAFGIFVTIGLLAYTLKTIFEYAKGFFQININMANTGFVKDE